MQNYFVTEQVIIRVTGEKSATFLHGQLTNDIKGLSPGQGNYNLLLTNKGKVRADLHVICAEGYCDLLVSANFVPVVMEHLKKLAPLSRCELKELTDKKTFHILAEIEEWKALELGASCPVNLSGKDFLVFRTNRLGVFGVDVIFDAPDESCFKKFLEEKSIRQIADEEVEKIRIKNGVPKVGVDVTEDNLPQEGRLEKALNFEKGCYLGQEVVARLKYRGHVNRILCRFEAEDSDESDFAAGHEITDQEQKKLGIITSWAFDEESCQAYLLGYLPYKTLESGQLHFLADQKSLLLK